MSHHINSTCQAVLIAGPTASGKSAVALALAERLGGVVINADSMQVYRDLCVLTARPTTSEMARAPHRLYGHVAAEAAYSTGQWLADLQALHADLARQGRLPLITGGTGLYFKVLLDGLSPIPEIPAAVRQYWRHEQAHQPAPQLHAILAQRDAETAQRLAPGDRQRIVRALEVLEATGVPLSQWQQRPGTPLFATDKVLKIYLSPDRGTLYQRCDARFDRMMAHGALDEVAALRARALPSSLPIMRALGVRPLMTYLDGKCSRADAITQAKTETRRYAKRQLTWARGQMASWHWLAAENREDLTQQILNFLTL